MNHLNTTDALEAFRQAEDKLEGFLNLVQAYITLTRQLLGDNQVGNAAVHMGLVNKLNNLEAGLIGVKKHIGDLGYVLGDLGYVPDPGEFGGQTETSQDSYKWLGQREYPTQVGPTDEPGEPEEEPPTAVLDNGKLAVGKHSKQAKHKKSK